MAVRELRGRGGRRTAAHRACPMLHNCLFCVDWAWYGIRARCKRRRNSYKLCLFYGWTAGVSFVVFMLAVTFYHILWQNIRDINKECVVSPLPKNDSTLRNLTLERGEAVSCSNEISSLGACDLSDMRAVLDAILTNGIANFLQSVLCISLSFAFRVFTNLPAERLQYDKTSRSTIVLGGLCKQGPWFARTLHVFQGCVLFVYGVLILANYCKGDLVKTHNCANYQRNCAYHKLRNCQYYYVHCQPDPAMLMKCFNAADRGGFSGRMDIRLLTHDHCTRCSILADDMQKGAEDDQFWLLQDSDRGTDLWACGNLLDSCFYTTQWNSLVCTCTDSIKSIMSTQRLTSLAGTCRHLASADEATVAEPPLQAEEAARRLQQSTAVSGAELPEQACPWAPRAPAAYFFAGGQCAQPGSYVFRFSLLYIYFAGCSWSMLTLFGQAVRLLSHPEPWFFNPRTPHEGIGWRFLRLMGP